MNRSELAAMTVRNLYGYAYDTIGNRLWSARYYERIRCQQSQSVYVGRARCPSASQVIFDYDADTVKNRK